ncbi:TPA: hypothetical protein N0F65_003188 [Lagenidium giganteum]|uniref:tRNA (adenine(58)-N(1))-methyltransferase non-catalytic subunit TRM6 n=1 Tax=Lagenidium giganteum TaxID=4803 RepID=A0AAV2ZAQ8_9STRA|nr:TPA: hypothetical protein N0F65_003188 [Lagenidium giganteum]
MTDAMEPRNPNVIHEGDTVICQTSDDRMFFQPMNKDETIRVGKKLTSVRPVFGAFYGSIFEVQNKKLTRVDGGLFPDPVAPETGESFVPDSDNRSYADTNSAQKLSAKEIHGLREEGASGQEIIKALVENSETWDAKTEFSKQKYLKKKQQKYMPRVRFLKCTAESLCRTYRLKNPSKILNMREDTLGQILAYANIHAKAQVLVVDTVMGLVTGAIAERQAGLGRILAPHDGPHPSADILRRWNFDKKTRESMHFFSFKNVALLTKKEEDIPDPEPERNEVTPEEAKRLEAERLSQYTEEERRAYQEKKAKKRANKITRQPIRQVREWVRQKSDALVIACDFDPERVLMALLPYLHCSKPFVIYSEYMEPLTKIFDKLQKMDAIIDLQLNETWTREYQVLPGRTHPEMKMNACSGYLLTGIKINEVVANPDALAAMSDVAEKPAKRAKTEEST